MGKDDFRPWWGTAPRELMDSLVEPLFEIGWHISMAGSVARYGIGRDLDLVITPTIDGAAPVAIVVGTLVADHNDWECVDHHINPILRSMQMVVVTGDDRLIDFYIGNEPSDEIRREVWLDEDLAEQGWGMGC